MKILIGGDSWGCGEWGYDNGNYCILHGGLDQYLINDGHNVTNTSKGRSSNNDSIRRLKENLELDTDITIWFQSDPLRDINFICNSFDEIIFANNTILLENYKLLNELNKPIHCIGGCSKINLQMMSKFSNLIPLIESIPSFLYPQFNHPDIWISDFIWDDLYNQLNNDMLSALLIRKTIVDSLHFGEYAEYFQPDGRHPNRLGHFKIYDYIKSVVRLT
jgi:hypothetical protein